LRGAGSDIGRPRSYAVARRRRSGIIECELVIAEPEIPLTQPRSRFSATPTQLFDDRCAPARGNDGGQIFEIESLTLPLVIGTDRFGCEPPRSRTPFEICSDTYALALDVHAIEESIAGWRPAGQTVCRIGIDSPSCFPR
jgi:hypothetical protein